MASLTTTATDIQLIRATNAHAPGINRILNHYVDTSVLTFATSHYSLEDTLAQILTVAEKGLPYIVAHSTSTSTSISPSAADKGQGQEQDVRGYAYATGFREGKAGYLRTAEISIFLDPAYRSLGLGSRLLHALLESLRKPEMHAHYFMEGTITGSRPIRPIHQVISCMAVDENGKDNGLALKRFYENFGFVEMGHLRRVGYKFDRW